MANRIDVHVFCEYPLTTLNIAFTKTSGEIPLTLLHKQGKANDTSGSLLRISVMLLNVFCNSFSRSSSSILESTIIRGQKFVGRKSINLAQFMSSGTSGLYCLSETSLIVLKRKIFKDRRICQLN